MFSSRQNNKDILTVIRNLSTAKKLKSFPDKSKSASIPSRLDLNDNVRTPEKPKSYIDSASTAVVDWIPNWTLSDSGGSDSEARSSASQHRSFSFPCQLNKSSNSSGLEQCSENHSQTTRTSVNNGNTVADNRTRMEKETGLLNVQYTPMMHSSVLNGSKASLNISANDAKAEESSDDAFEAFLDKLKSEYAHESQKQSSESSFIVSTSGSSSEGEDSSDLETVSPRNTLYRLENNRLKSHTWSSPELVENEKGMDEENRVFIRGSKTERKSKTNSRDSRRSAAAVLQRKNPNQQANPAAEARHEEFIYSLYPLDNSGIQQKENRPPRHPSAERYVKSFKANRFDLATRLFCIFNQTVFANSHRSARIELSIKICTTPERLRDTLLHEACHAAVWIVDGVREQHGRYWQQWAHRSKQAWPRLPLVMRCHNYQIDTPFTYRCLNCGACVHRHSKSVDIEKQVCSRCHGRFELVHNRCSTRLRSRVKTGTPRGTQQEGVLVAPPRTPAFAEFVQHNYRTVRQKRQQEQQQAYVKTGAAKSLHAEVMAELASLFKGVKLDEPQGLVSQTGCHRDQTNY